MSEDQSVETTEQQGEAHLQTPNAKIRVHDEWTARAAIELLQRWIPDDDSPGVQLAHSGGLQAIDNGNTPKADSDIPEVETPPSEMSEDDARDSDMVECEDCDREFETERGKNIHKAKAHPEDEKPEEPPTVEPTELHLEDYGDWEITELDVVEALDGAATVDEFQERMGLGEDQAEDLLHDLGVLELLDNGTDTIEWDEASTLVSEAIA